jgi:hypothetical protein
MYLQTPTYMITPAGLERGLQIQGQMRWPLLHAVRAQLGTAVVVRIFC